MFRFLTLAALAAPIALGSLATQATTVAGSARSVATSTAPADLQQEYRQRREALVSRLPDGVLLVIGEPEPRHDYLQFFQSPSFYYLTGFREPNAALVMVKRGGSVSSTMFVQPRVPAQEVWSGARFGT